MYNYTAKLLEEGIGIKPIEAYVNMKTKILHECPNGHVWSVKPTHIIHSKSGCPYCAGTVKITTEGHAKEVYPLTFVGQYKNRHSKLEYNCTHGHTWIATPHSIVNGKTGCPKCSRVYSPTTKEYMDKLRGRGMDVLGEYTNNNTPLSHRCNRCSNIWEASPGNVLGGTGCPECGGTRHKTHSEYCDQIAKLGMSTKDTYINNKTPLLHRCLKGHEVYSTPSNLLTRGGCTFCINSGPGRLYYIKFDGPNESTFYKIGITTKTVFGRITSMLVSNGWTTTVLLDKVFDNIEDARYLEQSILRELSHLRTSVDFVANGNTEFFTKDIMEYINARA